MEIYILLSFQKKQNFLINDERERYMDPRVTYTYNWPLPFSVHQFYMYQHYNSQISSLWVFLLVLHSLILNKIKSTVNLRNGFCMSIQGTPFTGTVHVWFTKYESYHYTGYKFKHIQIKSVFTGCYKLEHIRKKQK